MSTENKNICTQCHNQCPVDALKCGRGKAFFGEEGQMAENHGGEGHGGDGHGRDGHGREGHGRDGHGRDGHGRDGHGRDGHGRDGHGKGMPFDSNSLYGLMRACGHHLHHNQGNGSSQEESELFSALNEQEREELKSLLSKVLESWK